MPIRWQDGRRGWTRDISPDGAYVTLPGNMIPTRWCALEIGFAQAGLRFHALAEVVRVEPDEGDTGLALRLHARHFESER